MAHNVAMLGQSGLDRGFGHAWLGDAFRGLVRLDHADGVAEAGRATATGGVLNVAGVAAAAFVRRRCLRYAAGDAKQVGQSEMVDL